MLNTLRRVPRHVCCEVAPCMVFGIRAKSTTEHRAPQTCDRTRKTTLHRLTTSEQYASKQATQLCVCICLPGLPLIVDRNVLVFAVPVVLVLLAVALAWTPLVAFAGSALLTGCIAA
jgi:hypothetical protein